MYGLLFIAVHAHAVEFIHLTTKQGLSHNSVLSIFEDHHGFIWLATPDGLNRFDGFEFKIFRHIPHDPNSLDSNLIRAAIETSDGSIWVGTDFGLNRIDPKSWQVTRYPVKDELGERVSARDLLLADGGDQQGAVPLS